MRQGETLPYTADAYLLPMRDAALPLCSSQSLFFLLKKTYQSSLRNDPGAGQERRYLCTRKYQGQRSKRIKEVPANARNSARRGQKKSPEISKSKTDRGE
ncbi:hypothetical protein GCWU000342_02235 [Shuttleworthella satelles DSM 14600]|uniref:Uncharacterized protein n=1 Tax=Shuttleworthella satelles DSM 14600 TaxID=626523 RepID=C4GDR1_9FIRM|nr:hypothetical protein GCWU000342_02235 [Shuttleworthia satelles DSM 14600]